MGMPSFFSQLFWVDLKYIFSSSLLWMKALSITVGDSCQLMGERNRKNTTHPKSLDLGCFILSVHFLRLRKYVKMDYRGGGRFHRSSWNHLFSYLWLVQSISIHTTPLLLHLQPQKRENWKTQLLLLGFKEHWTPTCVGSIIWPASVTT